MKKFRYLATGCLALAVTAAGVVSSPLAHSATKAVPAAAALPSPDAVFQDWNNAFLVRSGNEAYYTTELKSKGTNASGTWIAALNVAVAEDAYERTHSPADWQLVKNLVTTFMASVGTTWTSWDTWNDDIGWMANAALRGYLATGDKSWLDTAMAQWNSAYNRGWSTADDGGIWENTTETSKCAVANNPMMFNGVELYRITGNKTYLTKAEAVYNWTYGHLVDQATGQVYDCIDFPDGPTGPTTVGYADLAYDAGAFIEAADALYRATGNEQYANAALRTANHFLDNDPVVANGSEVESSYQYWLFKGINDICTDTGTCAKYAAYLHSNAAKAWSERDSADLTWNNWQAPTTYSDPDAFSTNGMTALFQDFPVTGSSPFHGYYDLKNAASRKLLSVGGGSTASNAPIVDGTAAASDAWSFVRGSNGYYAIRNARSGQLINVKADSGAPDAKLVQWPAEGISQGNDQWQPIRNANGTWSFYNRNSQLALTVASGANGAQLVQKAQSNSASQQFTLVSV
jgi:hypothetical protein